jgi:hypothetical protein
MIANATSSQDAAIAKNAVELAQFHLKGLKDSENPRIQATKMNNWNGWFPGSSTSIVVVAPRYDPEAMEQANQPIPEAMLPYFPPGYIYPRQPGEIVKILNDKLLRRTGIPGPSVVKMPYRRRLDGDVMHMMDDRHLVVAVPQVDPVDGKVYTYLYHDGAEKVKINQLTL